MFAPTELLWALIGLILTIGGTLLEAFITSPPWSWGGGGMHVLSLGVSYQIGAVLLVGCLGGKNAAAISQIAYILLGLVGFNVFTEGHGIDYIYRPSFGYLLGFIPGAWVCGLLAFRVPTRLESLAFSCVMGLLTIHLTGLSYLLMMYSFNWVDVTASPLGQLIVSYSVDRLPGQLAVVCAVAVLSYVLRHLMFY
ncbi:biotin transporter BioY [Oculatella sp. LEGE 06141]|uniref:biotin transporter BioY n=1 Tax=Oculatella sp. LEGE 06141 TaxID=1828648 RepID=UPI001881C76D|nr:biotin transporter BioY [Oculatella sp. LEGE 06141]